MLMRKISLCYSEIIYTESESEFLADIGKMYRCAFTERSRQHVNLRTNGIVYAYKFEFHITFSQEIGNN